MRRMLLILGLALGVGAAAGAAAPRGDILIDDTGVHPESVTATREGAVITGSVKGILYRAQPGERVARAWIHPDAQNRLGAVFGVLAHEDSRTLWACSVPNPFAPPDPAATNAVVAFDLETGRFRARHAFPPGRAACNDMSVGPGGDLYVADTQGARLLRLPRGGASLEVFASDERLLGVDGIAFSGDGRLYINNVTTGAMMRVESGPGGFTGLTVLAPTLPLSGPDGLRLIAGNRFLQAEGGAGRITEVTMVGDEARIRVLRDGLDGPPGVTPAGDRAYAIEGKIRYLIDPQLRGQDPGPFRVVEIALD